MSVVLVSCVSNGVLSGVSGAHINSASVSSAGISGI